MSIKDKRDTTINAFIFGKTDVGKTTFFKNVACEYIPEGPTTNFSNHTIQLGDGAKAEECNIFDIPGLNDEYVQLKDVKYAMANMHLCIFMVAYDNSTTISEALRDLDQVKEAAQFGMKKEKRTFQKENKGFRTKFLLIANKADLKEEGSTMQDDIGKLRDTLAGQGLDVELIELVAIDRDHEGYKAFEKILYGIEPVRQVVDCIIV